MSVDVEALFDAFRQFIGRSSMAPQEFGELFHQSMRAMVKFDYIVVFAYRGNERPIDLYSTFNVDEHVIFVSMYQAGPLFAGSLLPHGTGTQARCLAYARTGARPVLFERILPDLLCSDRPCGGGRLFRSGRSRYYNRIVADAARRDGIFPGAGVCAAPQGRPVGRDVGPAILLRFGPSV